MSVESISPLVNIDSLQGVAKSGPSIEQGVFDHLVNVDQKLKAAEHQAQMLAVGEADNLHQVMISISKAKTAFEFTAEVRNRLLESFQDVLKMQI